MAERIAVIIEHEQGIIRPSAWEMISLAEKIASWEEYEICLVILGADTDTLSAKISRSTGYDIYAVTAPELGKYNGSLYKDALVKLFSKAHFNFICAPHSMSGMDYIPALSVDLQAQCITGVNTVLFEEGKVCFTRSMFGGKISAKFSADDALIAFTVQPGAFKPVPPEKTGPGRIIKMEYECREGEMKYTGSIASPSSNAVLGKAEVIVSGGRGLKEKENYKYIELMAESFQRSATGASRPICDYNWVTYSKQVGITGSIVSPKLYIACGISGASQHIEGITGSQFIAAINTDHDAPIFQAADICIVEDAVEFIRLFNKKIKE